MREANKHSHRHQLLVSRLARALRVPVLRYRSQLADVRLSWMPPIVLLLTRDA